eukprot:264808-Pleurochrysis_carterae.AAC.1
MVQNREGWVDGAGFGNSKSGHSFGSCKDSNATPIQYAKYRLRGGRKARLRSRIDERRQCRHVGCAANLLGDACKMRRKFMTLAVETQTVRIIE